jgi:COP9 signalosome complex subunit 5
VLDSVALPVEATETTVSARLITSQFVDKPINEEYSELGEKLGSFPFIGWYHSHPSYGCWLSRIDVATQANYQMNPDPWLAIVIDPIRTITRGICVSIFRKSLNRSLPNIPTHLRRLKGGWK